MMLTGLDRVLRAANVPYRECPNWKATTGRSAGVSLPKGILWHHTATSAAQVKAKNNPTLNYVRDGLGYPLCQLLLAYDGSVDIVAAGWCAHAGKGVYPGIARDTGNDVLIGIEVEGTIGLPWSPAQLESAARIGAAFDAEFGKLIHIGHYEWAPIRKTDPSGIPGNMPALRQAITRGAWTGLTPVTSKPIPTVSKPNPKPVVIVTPPKEPELSAAEVLDIKAHIDAKLAELPRNVWAYDQDGKAGQAWGFLRDSAARISTAVWHTKAESKAPGAVKGRTYKMIDHVLATNGHVYATEAKLDAALETLATIAASETATAHELRAQIRAAIEGLTFGLVSSEETPDAEVAA